MLLRALDAERDPRTLPSNRFPTNDPDAARPQGIGDEAEISIDVRWEKLSAGCDVHWVTVVSLFAIIDPTGPLAPQGWPIYLPSSRPSSG